MTRTPTEKVLWSLALLALGGVVGVFVLTAHSPHRKNKNNPQEQVSLGKPAPNATFTTLNGKTFSLSAYKGKKIMLWFVATWCSSCQEGARVLAAHENALHSLTIIPVETYGDGGYPGPAIQAFAKESAPQTLTNPLWVWGEASQKATALYNPKNYADIYFLIDKKGIVRAISGSPSVTLDTILSFARPAPLSSGK